MENIDSMGDNVENDKKVYINLARNVGNQRIQQHTAVSSCKESNFIKIKNKKNYLKYLIFFNINFNIHIHINTKGTSHTLFVVTHYGLLYYMMRDVWVFISKLNIT